MYGLLTRIDWLLFAILLNGLGSLLVVLPEFPLFKSHVATNETIRVRECIREKVLNPLPDVGENRIYIGDRDWLNHLPDSANVEYVGDEEWFEEFVSIIEKYTHQTPSRVSVFQDDGGTVGVRIFHKEPDDTPEGQAGQYQMKTPQRVSSWVGDEIEHQRTKIQLRYLRRGAVLLLLGFSVQFLSRMGILP